MNFSAWFDALPVVAKIGGVIVITLAAMGAAAGFVGSIVRFAHLMGRLMRRTREKHGRDERT